MTTTRESARDRFFNAILERQETIFDSIRSSNDRYHRFARSLIEGARQRSRDWTEVRRRFVQCPTDIVGVSEAVGNSQARTLALAREWLDDLVESQRESREVIRRGLGDMREAVERVQADAPSFLRARPQPLGPPQREGTRTRPRGVGPAQRPFPPVQVHLPGAADVAWHQLIAVLSGCEGFTWGKTPQEVGSLPD